MSLHIFDLVSFLLCFIYAAEGHIPSGDYRDIPNSFFDSKREVPLVKNLQKNDGSYRFGFKLKDQMREETRTPDGEVSGSYGFVDPSGAAHELQYRAGRQGFLAKGTSLPKAPSYTPEVLEARKKFLNYFNSMKNFLKSMSGDDDSESDSNSDSKSEEEEENWDTKKSNEDDYDSSEENDYEGEEESEEEEDGGEHGDEEHKDGGEHGDEEHGDEEHEDEEHEDEGHEDEGHEDEGHEDAGHEDAEHEEEEHEREEHEGEEHEGEHEAKKHEGSDPDEVTVQLEGNFYEGDNKGNLIVYNKNKRNTESVKEVKLSESAILRNKARGNEASEVEEENLDGDVNEDKLKQKINTEDKKDSLTLFTEPKDGELKNTQKENGETQENEHKELLKEKINKGILGEVKKENKRDISSVSKFQNWIETPQKRRFPRLIKFVRKIISSKF